MKMTSPRAKGPGAGESAEAPRGSDIASQERRNRPHRLRVNAGAGTRRNSEALPDWPLNETLLGLPKRSGLIMWWCREKLGMRP